MAVTIITQPYDGTGETFHEDCYRSIIYKVSSDEVNIARMSVEIDFIRTDNSGTNTVVAVILPDIGTTNEFTYDIKQVSQDQFPIVEIANDLPGSTTGTVTPTTDTHLVAAVNFTEILDDNTTPNPPKFANTIYVHPSVLQHEENQDFDDQYNNNAPLVKSRQFLTHLPVTGLGIATNSKTSFIRMSEDYFLQVIYKPRTFPNPTSSVIMRVASYDVGGVFIQNDDVLLPNNVFDETRFNIPCGYVNLETLGLLPFVNQTAYFYTIQIIGAATVPPNPLFDFTTELVQFIVRDEPCVDTRIWWLNDLGAWDAFTFTGRKRESVDPDKSLYERSLPSNFVVKDTGREVLKSEGDDQLAVFTGPINKAQLKWFKELVTSPKVFLQDGSKFVPLIVSDNTKKLIDSQPQLNNLPMEFIKSNKVIRQRG